MSDPDCITAGSSSAATMVVGQKSVVRRISDYRCVDNPASPVASAGPHKPAPGHPIAGLSAISNPPRSPLALLISPADWQQSP